MKDAADLAKDFSDDSPSGLSQILRAGKLSLLYERGGLRYLRVGANEIVRGIYVAVRDHNWETIPGRIVDFRLESSEKHFRISYTAEHLKGPVDFRWDAEIIGSSDGTVEFTMKGRARSAFRKNRIGFCLLHPMHVAGVPCTVRHSDGRREDGAFPRDIAPRQPFLDVASIEYEVGGLRALILGAGGLGSALGARLSALGVRCTGVRRRVERGVPKGFERVVGPGEWRSLLPETDIVALCAPSTPEINAKRMTVTSLSSSSFLRRASFKPSQVLKNILNPMKAAAKRKATTGSSEVAPLALEK